MKILEISEKFIDLSDIDSYENGESVTVTISGHIGSLKRKVILSKSKNDKDMKIFKPDSYVYGKSGNRYKIHYYSIKELEEKIEEIKKLEEKVKKNVVKKRT